MNSEEWRTGYRVGFEAGKMSAIESARQPLPPKPRRTRTSTPKCADCGHAARTHGELGYCVGHTVDRMPDGTKYRGECICTGFRAPVEPGVTL